MAGIDVLDDGYPPAHWVRELADRGIIVSERTIREWANKAGACFRIGRQMLITTDHMNRILKSKEGRPSRSAGEMPSTGRRTAHSNGRKVEGADDPRNFAVEHALERLQKLALGDRKRSGRSK